MGELVEVTELAAREWLRAMIIARFLAAPEPPTAPKDRDRAAITRGTLTAVTRRAPVSVAPKSMTRCASTSRESMEVRPPGRWAIGG